MSNRELSLFDIADWLWSYRLLALSLLVIAGVWAAVSIVSAQGGAFTNQYEVHVRIFPGGSPLRGVPDISSIIITNLEKTGSVELSSAPDENPLVFKASEAKRAEEAVQKVVNVGVALVEEVKERVALLVPIIATNESAMTPYLLAKSFLAGTDSDLLELVAPKSILVSSSVTSPSLVRAVLFPILVCGIAFFMLALGTSFVRSWRRRKITGA